MDQNEHLSLDDQVGSEMMFHLRSEYNAQNKTWKTIGKGKFGTTFDLQNWGYVEREVMAYDDDLSVSIAIVMKTLSEMVYEEDFHKRLLESLNDKEKNEA